MGNRCFNIKYLYTTDCMIYRLVCTIYVIPLPPKTYSYKVSIYCVPTPGAVLEVFWDGIYKPISWLKESAGRKNTRDDIKYIFFKKMENDC